MKPERLTKGVGVRGLAVASAEPVGFHGQSKEVCLDVVEAARPWSFNADRELFRLVSEAASDPSRCLAEADLIWSTV